MREQVEALEDHADVGALARQLGLGQRREAAVAGVSRRRRAAPSIRTSPPSSGSRSARQRSSVLLPEPDGPRIALTSPRLMLNDDAPEHPVRAVLAVDVDRLEDGDLRRQRLELGDDLGIEDLVGEGRIAGLGRQVPAHRAAPPKPRSTPKPPAAPCDAQT